ncbi:hypothetical protein BD408DRAFT_420862 [Parasitella parasitica]|nr:hypothetical protein BD408DRAFT_420862 [Parasitella parasitica]
MSHIKIHNKLFMCNKLFIMSTANNITSTPNSTIKRRKRLLSSATRSVQKEKNERPLPPSSPPPLNTFQKKRKRKLNTPTVDKSVINERASSTSPPPTALASTIFSQQPATPMPTPAKRSIRAAQEAIAKREKQRQVQKARPPFSPSKSALPHPEKTPVIKKKRKLNTQRVLIPKSSSSQEFEENGDEIYDKYLESNTAATRNMAARISPRNHASSVNIIPAKDETKPAIVIGVPTRKRKLVSAARSIIKSTEQADAATAESVQNGDVKTSKLDLSQHSILPNQSYVAHLPQSQINRRRRSLTASTTTSATSSIGGSIVSHTDLTASETMFTMETYTTKSSPTIFYDAISDFEDMIIDDQMVDQDAMLINQIDTEEPSSQQQSLGSFWGSILKPFQH